MNEAAIRDLLAADLSVLEEGMELVEIEQYIPKSLGTRSFLDILAKDKAGHWVIVEVKKTDAAARQAAHEVFKYVEAIQNHFGVRTDEIRAIVASVEWTELLVPFSRLRSETNIAVEGVQLLPDASGKSLKLRAIEPVPVNKGRYLAPWHELNLYRDTDDLEQGLVSYDRCCEAKGIDNYVLLVLKAADDFNEMASLAFGQALQQLAQNFGDGNSEKLPVHPGQLDQFEYILYFAPQIQSREFCLTVLARDPEKLEEVRAFTQDMTAEAELCTLHENVYDLDPRPQRDWFEIGYAAKLSQKLLIDEGWTIERVERRGTFARNTLLSDGAIVDELKGSTGSSHQSFKRAISLSNRAHIASAKEGLAEALSTNPAWLAQVTRVLGEASAAWPEGSASITLFGPSSGVFTLFFIATEGSESHLPQYEVAVFDDDEKLVSAYVGLLVPEGRPLTLQQLLDKYYEGRMGQLMLLAGAGFFEIRDADVMDDLGLAYRTFRVDEPEGTAKYFALKDDRWRPFAPTVPWQPLQPYFDQNAEFINEITAAIGARMHGGFHDLS